MLKHFGQFNLFCDVTVSISKTDIIKCIQDRMTDIIKCVQDRMTDKHILSELVVKVNAEVDPSGRDRNKLKTYYMYNLKNEYNVGEILYNDFTTLESNVLQI